MSQQRVIDPATETRRQAYIEKLYEASGRTCGTYSGLFQEHLWTLIQADMDKVLGGQG